MFLRLAGLHELLCNNCGLEFKGFDPFGRLKRAPSAEIESKSSKRRAPRYKVHLPAAISLIEGNAKTGKVTYSPPSRGHCESISKVGMMLSFVGTRFPEEELSRAGRLLFVSVNLPNSPIEAVLSIVNHNRPGIEEGGAKWLVGASIYQIGEDDATRLATYLDKRAEAEPPIPLGQTSASSG